MKEQPKEVTEGNSAKGEKSEGLGGIGLFDVVFPFLIPIKGIIWIANKIKEAADAEITDKSKVQEELLKLQTRFEMKEINEEEYEKEETRLLEKLEAIRKYREKEEGR